MYLRHFLKVFPLIFYVHNVYIPESLPGKVLSRESLFIKMRREILALTKGRSEGKLRLLLHPNVCEYFQQRKHRFEHAVKRQLEIQSDSSLKWEDYKLILE